MAPRTCWTIDLPVPYEPLPREGTSADVVVIGGGLMGTATTYWLARQGCRVVLLEACHLASGSTGRNAGLALHNLSELEDPALLYEVRDREQLRLDYSVPGHLSLASRPDVWDAFRAEVERRPAWAPPLHAIDRRDCEELLRLRLHEQYPGGRWYPGGAVVHPVQFTCELARAATAYGARIHTQTTVTRIDASPNGMVVTTTRGSVDAKGIVHATAASRWLLPELAPVMRPLRVQVMSTDQLSPIFPMGLGVNWGDVFGRQLANGCVVLGGGGSTPVTDDRHNDEIDAVTQSRLRDFLPCTFPDLPALSTVTHMWSGVLDCTVDGRPIVGRHPGRGGQWLCVGFNGHGIPGALGIGRSIAMAIDGGVMSSAMSRCAPDRFESLVRVNDEPMTIAANSD